MRTRASEVIVQAVDRGSVVAAHPRSDNKLICIELRPGGPRTSEGVDVASDGTNYMTSASRHNGLKIRDDTIVADVGEG